MPPLLLDDEEAIAAAVALLAGPGGGVASAGDTALRALTKLDRVLPARLRHEVRALADRWSPSAGGRRPVDPEGLTTLARACRDEVEAAFHYPSGKRGAAAAGQPYRLVASDGRRHLSAYDVDRDDWRSFRVDRMSEAAARTRRFRPGQAPDAAAYVQEGVASRVYRYQARFLVDAPSDTVRRRSRRRRRSYDPGAAGGARCSPAGPASTSSSWTWCCWGHDFKVIEPPELGQRCHGTGPEDPLSAGAGHH